VVPIRVIKELERGMTVVVAGSQGVNKTLDITTLGRGGSDTTAVALAAALEADECEINTDVPGILTADPRIVPEARLLSAISYDEMLELSSLGAKVMHPRGGRDRRALRRAHQGSWHVRRRAGYHHHTEP